MLQCVGSAACHSQMNTNHKYFEWNWMRPILNCYNNLIWLYHFSNFQTENRRVPTSVIWIVFFSFKALIHRPCTNFFRFLFFAFLLCSINFIIISLYFGLFITVSWILLFYLEIFYGFRLFQYEKYSYASTLVGRISKCSFHQNKSGIIIGFSMVIEISRLSKSTWNDSLIRNRIEFSYSKYFSRKHVFWTFRSTTTTTKTTTRNSDTQKHGRRERFFRLQLSVEIICIASTYV